MAKQERTPEQKRLDTDIWVIVITVLAVLGLYIFVQERITAFIRNTGMPVLVRVLASAAVQFSLAGLGICIVSVMRKESFLAHGLRLKGALPSMALCVLCFVPFAVFALATGRIDSYMPFQSVWTTREVLSSGFPANVLGMLLTVTAWGFFEGFNYVFISDKINARYPSKSRWLNWGAIICGVLCILIHGAIGVTLEGVVEMVTLFIIIYGMLLVRDFTGNSWGCVLIFILLWNAF